MKSRILKWLYPVYLVLILFAALEIYFRIEGVKPWNPDDMNMQRSPDGPVFQPDSLLGFVGVPGTYSITVRDSITWQITRGIDGNRITHHGDSSAIDKPQIWIFGCSFTEGFGVNDDETYAWLLQEKFPEYEIRNFGVSAYNTVQSLLQMRREQNKGVHPALVILAYGGFHDQRNVCSPFWLKAVGGNHAVAKFQMPYCTLLTDSTIQIGGKELVYHPYIGSIFFSFINFLDNEKNRRVEAELNIKNVSEKIIALMKDEANSESSKFFVAGIWSHPDTQSMIDRLNARRIPAKDISIPSAGHPEYFIPGDGHPNAAGHRRFAEQLEVIVRENMK